MTWNPWREARIFRRAFDVARERITFLEMQVANRDAQIAALEKLRSDYEGLVEAHKDRTKAFADLARARNFGIDAELADVGL